MANQIVLRSPSITGTIRETAYYQPMSVGQTAPLLLIAHADVDQPETPYQVKSLKEAINWLKADSNSPLLRAMLEAYNMGCRDIWLYAAAPMSEYESDVSVRNDVNIAFGNKTFYQRYKERLDTAYAILRQYDKFHTVVPVEASLCETGSVNFVEPLAELCENIVNDTGHSTLGVIGTRSSSYDQALIDTIEADTFIANLGDKGKYIMGVFGEGVMANGQMSATYTAPYATLAGALLCSIPLSRSIYGLTFNPAITVTHFDLKESQVEQLAQAKVNPVIRTQQGKRGLTFETMLVTDNTMAPDGSDFWSMNQMRTVTQCINDIQGISNAYIGTIASDSFKQEVLDYFKMLRAGRYIKEFAVDVIFEKSLGKAYVDVGITPMFGIRNIYFTVETGPGA